MYKFKLGRINYQFFPKKMVLKCKYWEVKLIRKINNDSIEWTTKGWNLPIPTQLKLEELYTNHTIKEE